MPLECRAHSAKGSAHILLHTPNCQSRSAPNCEFLSGLPSGDRVKRACDRVFAATSRAAGRFLESCGSNRAGAALLQSAQTVLLLYPGFLPSRVAIAPESVSAS